MQKKSAIKTLTTIGSCISIVFGIWHFFIPGIWNWYSYIDAAAPELVIAILAINILRKRTSQTEAKMSTVAMSISHVNA